MPLSRVAPFASRPRGVKRTAIAVFVFWWLATLMTISDAWLLANFGRVELSQFVYHVINFAEVIKPLGAGFVTLSVLLVAVVPLAVAGLATSITLVLISRAHGHFAPHVSFSGGKARRRSVGYSRRPLVVASLVPLLVVGVATPAFATNVGVLSFIQDSKPSTFIEHFYQTPEYIQKPETPTNLVIIYVESLENTYREPELWGENLLDSLDEATSEWFTFPDFQEVRGTGWTIAGMVASQCGVLLKEENHFDIRQQLGLKSINRIGERVDSFMPGITCLGDILQSAGYTSHFLGGANPEFAGKGKFLTEHGYDVVKGQPHWESVGETAFTKWGLNDDKLLEHAKKELDTLHAAGQPFNLTVLTVDTHRPEGHLSETCEKRGVTDLPGIVSCTSDLLADFVEHMDSRGYLEDTAVVITGDHLTMPNVVQDTIDLEPHRTIYNRFWSPRPMAPNRDEMIHFSMLPTILDMLGFDYPGNELALGVSGVGPIDPQAFTIYDVVDLDDQLRRPSELYDVFWGIDRSPAS